MKPQRVDESQETAETGPLTSYWWDGDSKACNPCKFFAESASYAKQQALSVLAIFNFLRGVTFQNAELEVMEKELIHETFKLTHETFKFSF